MLKYQSSPRHRDSSLGYFSRFTYSSSIHCSSKQQSAGVPALLGIHRIRCLITHTLHTCCNRLTSSCFSCRTSSASLCSASSCCLRSATSLMCCRTIHRQFKGNVTEIMSYVLPRAMELKHGLYLTEEKVRNSCHKPEQHKENLKISDDHLIFPFHPNPCSSLSQVPLLPSEGHVTGSCMAEPPAEAPNLKNRQKKKKAKRQPLPSKNSTKHLDSPSSLLTFNTCSRFSSLV